MEKSKVFSFKYTPEYFILFYKLYNVCKKDKNSGHRFKTLDFILFYGGWLGGG